MAPRRFSLFAVLLLLPLAGCTQPTATRGDDLVAPGSPRLTSNWTVAHEFEGTETYEASVEYFPRGNLPWNGTVEATPAPGGQGAEMLFYQVYFERADGTVMEMGTPRGRATTGDASIHIAANGQPVVVPFAGTPLGSSYGDLHDLSSFGTIVGSIGQHPAWNQSGWLRLMVAYVAPPESRAKATLSLVLRTQVPTFGEASERKHSSTPSFLVRSERGFKQESGVNGHASLPWTVSAVDSSTAELRSTRTTWFLFAGTAGPFFDGSGSGELEIQNRTHTTRRAFGGPSNPTMIVGHHEAGPNEWRFNLQSNGITEAMLAYAEFPAVVPRNGPSSLSGDRPASDSGPETGS